MHGLDKTGMSGVLLDLSPEVPNMDVDTAVERRPDAMTGEIQELDAAEDPVWMRREYRQKLELSCRQRNLLSLRRNQMA
jgi:hypothetical protein